MRILLVTNRIPWPLKDGGAICMYQSIRGYQEAGLETGLLSMNTVRHQTDFPKKNKVFSHLDFYREVPIDNRITPGGALKSMVSENSYVLSRFISEEFEKSLAQSIADFQPDVVQYETLSTAYYLAGAKKKYPNIEHVYRMHNVEHKIWYLLSEKSKNPLKKYYLNSSASKLQKEEADIFANCEKVLCIQESEAIWLQNQFPNIKKRVYPFAINPKEIEKKKFDHLNFFHLGSMDWQPNIDAMKWWVDDIWPLFQTPEENPFFMAGRNMVKSEFERKGQRGMHLVGEVDDVDDFLRDKAVLCIPLRSGGGMRIKVLEAMQKGIVVIGTTIGLQGISGEDNKHFFIANTPAEFIKKMNLLIQNPELLSRVSSNAQEMIENNYNLVREIQENLTFFR